MRERIPAAGNRWTRIGPAPKAFGSKWVHNRTIVISSVVDGEYRLEISTMGRHLTPQQVGLTLRDFGFDGADELEGRVGVRRFALRELAATGTGP